MIHYQKNKRKLEFKYSVIICNRQYDFGNKKYKIFLEVHGDYWHGNPKLYANLNSTQKKNVEKDISKKSLAIKYGYKLFTIWENDILNSNFDVLDKIQEYINEI